MSVSRAFFRGDDDIFFSAAESGRQALYRVREDGSGVQKAMADPVIYVYDVSPDGRAAAAWPPDTGVQIMAIGGNGRINATKVCAAAGGENRGITPPCVSWSQNGKFLYLNDRVAGRIYALPVQPGSSAPKLPAEGIASAEQIAALPGAQVINEASAFVGADPSVYAFFRVTTQRNIYRVRVHSNATLP
jgi:sugar lactone lactonase YvrE